eukprot:Gb_15048 [translate_table: standard]
MAVSMPYRIQRIDEFIRQLDAGDFKLRVRVLEAERAARRASVLQMATIYTVLGGSLLNVGITLTAQGMDNFATGSYIGAEAEAGEVEEDAKLVKPLTSVGSSKLSEE